MLYANNKTSQWYVGNGCSKHMTGGQFFFINLKRKEKGSVIFGDDVSAKILGNGTFNLRITELKKKMCY